MFAHLGAFVSRHWVWVILGWIALAVGINFAAPRWDDVTHDGDLAYLPADMPSVQGERLLAEAFPDNSSKSQVVLVVERPDGPLISDDYAAVERIRQHFADGEAGDLPLGDVWSPADEVIGDKLLSAPHAAGSGKGQAALVVLHLTNEFMATDNVRVLDIVKASLDDFRGAAEWPAGLKVGISGSAAIGGDMLGSAAESIEKTELATVVLVFAILLVVYRAPLLVVIPLATIAVSVMVATDLVAMLTQVHRWEPLAWLDFKIFKTTKIFVVVLLFGSGTDFCLFLISRYKEELDSGRDKAAAVARALAQIGDALVGSALTTIVGLGTMFFADFGKYRNSGPAIGLCLFVALAACITLAPAILRGFGGAVFWPFGHSRTRAAGAKRDEAGRQPAEASRFWLWTGRAIVARPGLILVLCIGLLLPAAYNGLSVEVTYDLLSELQHDRASVVGTTMLKDYFPPGDTGPVVLLVEQTTPSYITIEDEQSGMTNPRQYRRIDGAWHEVTLRLIEDARPNDQDVVLDRPVSEISAEEALKTYGDPYYAAAKRRLESTEVEQAKLGRWLAFSKPDGERNIDGERQIAVLTKSLFDMGGVARVRSISEPLGDMPGTVANIFTPTGRRKLAALNNPQTRRNFISSAPETEGVVSRLDLVLATDPFSRESRETLNRVDEKLTEIVANPHSFWHGARFFYVGTTAGTRDLAAVTESDRLLIQKLVVIAVLGVLILILRRPLICVYLITTVLFSYFVTIGATELCFSWLWADSFHGLDWKAPLFLFVILVAVGQDYNIYLVTRVFEEQKRHGAIGGLQVALGRTGGIITSCGVIMAGTFSSMMISSLRGMIELGFALSLGVLLDTFVVRTIMVPAMLALWWRRGDSSSTPRQAQAEKKTSPPETPQQTPVVPERHVTQARRTTSR